MRYLISVILLGLVGLTGSPTYAQDVNADLEQARKTASQLRQELRALKKEAQEAAAFEEQRVASQKKQEVLQTQRQEAAAVRQQPAPPAAALEKFEQRLAVETEKVEQVRDTVLAEQQKLNDRFIWISSALALLALLQLAIFLAVRRKQSVTVNTTIEAPIRAPFSEPPTIPSPEPEDRPSPKPVWADATPAYETYKYVVAPPVVSKTMLAEPVTQFTPEPEAGPSISADIPNFELLDESGADFVLKGIPADTYERVLERMCAENRQGFMYLPNPV